MTWWVDKRRFFIVGWSKRLPPMRYRQTETPNTLLCCHFLVFSSWYLVFSPQWPVLRCSLIANISLRFHVTSAHPLPCWVSVEFFVTICCLIKAPNCFRSWLSWRASSYVCEFSRKEQSCNERPDAGILWSCIGKWQELYQLLPLSFKNQKHPLFILVNTH